MDKAEALQIVRNVCANTNTNLEGHQKIQTALNVIQRELFPDPKEKAADPAKE